MAGGSDGRGVYFVRIHLLKLFFFILTYLLTYSDYVCVCAISGSAERKVSDLLLSFLILHYTKKCHMRYAIC